MPKSGLPAEGDNVIAVHPSVPVVHIVDDDEAVRRSLALLLRSFGHVTRLYASAEALLGKLEGLEPGCVIADIRMPGMDGIAMQKVLARQQPDLPVVMVTGFADVALAVQAMKSGAMDFIEKPYSDQDILQAVTAAFARVADARQHREAAEQAEARIAVLTPRERDVLSRLVDGWPNKVIGHELGISPRTVEFHRANILEKTGVKNACRLVRLELEEPRPATDFASYGEVEACDGRDVRLLVSRERLTEVVARLLADLDVRDLEVSDPPIEELIGRLFRQGEVA